MTARAELRCAECGIADKDVRQWTDCIAHDNDACCRDAALALLAECRPYVDAVASSITIQVPPVSNKLARAMLRKMPVKP